MAPTDQDYISKDDLFSILTSMKITLPRTSKMSTEALSKRLREAFNASQRTDDLIPSSDFLDPQALVPWADLEELVIKTAGMQQSLREGLEMMQGGGSEKKETMGQMQDVVEWVGLQFGKGVCDLYVADRYISDWALAIRILGVYSVGECVPVYVVSYRTVGSIPNKSLLTQLSEVLSKNAEGHTSDELVRRAFLRLLQMNAKKLTPGYAPAGDLNKKYTKKKWKLSFLLPLGPLPMTDVGKLTSEAGCEVCGSTKNGRRCTECMTVVYCSPECQKADWPTHRSSCRTLKDGTWTTIDFGENPSSPLDDDPMTGMVMQLMNVNESWASPRPGAPRVGAVDVPPNIHGNKVFMVKFQVGLGGGQPTHMLLYDRKRSFRVCWKRKGDAEAFAVGERAMGYEMKMYRWAKRVDDRRMSVCFDKAPSEMPPW